MSAPEASVRMHSDAEVLADPRWFPHAFDSRRQSLEFRFAERDYWSDKRFLDERWLRERLPERTLSIDAVAAGLGAAQPHLGFVWHTSFCCSTLLADLLEAAGRNLALREPQVLVTLANARREGGAAPYGPVFRLLARRFEGDAHVTVKPSNFANNLIEMASAHTAGRMLFLYSDLPSFLIAVARKGQDGRAYARTLLSSLAADGLLPPAIERETQLSDAKVAALAWHLQIANFARAMKALGPERAASLDCEVLLADPAGTLTALDSFFELGLGGDHIAQAVDGPLMNRHAKTLAGGYSAASRKAEIAAARRELGPALDDVIAWSHAMCPATPRGVPLSYPLMTIEQVRSS